MSDARPDLPLRETARALVIDPDGRLLLICYEASRDVDPARPGKRDFWYAPGGGREPGESAAENCLRELAEETGMTDIVLGPVIARRAAPQTLFRRPSFVDETWFLVRAPGAEIDTGRLQETESDPVLGVRWWTLAEILATDAVFDPPGLPGLFARIARGDVPGEPIDLGKENTTIGR